VAATGGAATESLDAVKARGPQKIRHGGRGISAEDLEWLAREATPEVARARCLSLTGPAGHAQRGWVTLIIVPFSQEVEPQPSAQTKRRVRDYLVARVPVALSKGIRVTGPKYTLVGIRAEIVPLQPDQAAVVEARLRNNLNSYLHPLTGGQDRQGWQFGQPVRLSEIARVIETTEGVDYAAQLIMLNDGHIFDELIPVDADGLVASGSHELTLTVGAR
jgi:predicted phage baseplate assembly protein